MKKEEITYAYCEASNCPNALYDEKHGRALNPSYCLDVDSTIEEEHKPRYFCLPCAYRSGAVV